MGRLVQWVQGHSSNNIIFCLLCSAFLAVVSYGDNTIPLFYDCWSFILFFQAQLSAMHVARFHSASKAPSPVYLKGYKEPHGDKDTKTNNHSKLSKIFSVDASVPESKGQKKRSNSIQEFSESFEKQLRFRTKRSTSLVSTYDWCKNQSLDWLLPLMSPGGSPFTPHSKVYTALYYLDFTSYIALHYSYAMQCPEN